MYLLIYRSVLFAEIQIIGLRVGTFLKLTTKDEIQVSFFHIQNDNLFSMHILKVLSLLSSNINTHALREMILQKLYFHQT